MRRSVTRKQVPHWNEDLPPALPPIPRYHTNVNRDSRALRHSVLEIFLELGGTDGVASWIFDEKSTTDEQLRDVVKMRQESGSKFHERLDSISNANHTVIVEEDEDRPATKVLGIFARTFRKSNASSQPPQNSKLAKKKPRLRTSKSASSLPKSTGLPPLRPEDLPPRVPPITMSREDFVGDTMGSMPQGPTTPTTPKAHLASELPMEDEWERISLAGSLLAIPTEVENPFLGLISPPVSPSPTNTISFPHSVPSTPTQERKSAFRFVPRFRSTSMKRPSLEKGRNDTARQSESSQGRLSQSTIGRPSESTGRPSESSFRSEHSVAESFDTSTLPSASCSVHSGSESIPPSPTTSKHSAKS
ncbi:hypothetical protein C8J56DRAFT_1056044 [Mycena floridula]|nr:hypothetical protein C8J56DRAFT_1056044 [Mycena floridula]